MANITRLIKNIIPYPDDREHRDGFSNEAIIAGLSGQERKQVESLLIGMLSKRPDDLLIVTTLGYLKSHKAVPILNKLLNETKFLPGKVIIACSLYEISKDDALIDMALETTAPLKKWWDLIDLFYYLAKLKNKKSDDFVRSYFNHEEYLVSYNAKRAMGEIKS